MRTAGLTSKPFFIFCIFERECRATRAVDLTPKYLFDFFIVPAKNKQDKLGTSVTLPMQSVISSVGLFPVGTCLLGPRRGYL